jgi:hypothetical protein
MQQGQYKVRRLLSLRLGAGQISRAEPQGSAGLKAPLLADFVPAAGAAAGCSERIGALDPASLPSWSSLSCASFMP